MLRRLEPRRASRLAQQVLLDDRLAVAGRRGSAGRPSSSRLNSPIMIVRLAWTLPGPDQTPVLRTVLVFAASSWKRQGHLSGGGWVIASGFRSHFRASGKLPPRTSLSLSSSSSSAQESSPSVSSSREHTGCIDRLPRLDSAPRFMGWINPSPVVVRPRQTELHRVPLATDLINHIY